VLPEGIAATGFPRVQGVCRQIGIEFDRWQQDLNRCILAKDAAGLYAADTVALSIPRQVGKTYDIGGLVFADSIIDPGTTTVWTAHRFKVARESFNEMRGWAKSPQLRLHIDYDDITTAAGNECIPFRNGSRIVFAARERGAVRGFANVRRVVLDEAQILTEQALADLVPTMNQATNPQLILMGTPPKPTDPSEVFTRLRAGALEGSEPGLLYVELSAPPDSDPDDRQAWRIANPSFPHRTPEKAIMRLKKLLSPADFQREALGIWDSARPASPIAAVWSACLDRASQVADPVAFAVDVAPDEAGAYAAVGVAGRRADGLGHGELIRHQQGTLGLVDFLVERAERHGPCALVLDPSGPAGSLVADLNERGFVPDPGPGQWRLHLVGAREYAQACGALAAAVKNEVFRHIGQVPLDDAADRAGTRPLADAWAWSRKGGVDITPLVVVTLARHGHAVHGVSAPPIPLVAWR
jgi:hypothetical protein